MVKNKRWLWMLVPLLAFALLTGVLLSRPRDDVDLHVSYPKLRPRFDDHAAGCRVDADCVLSTDLDGDCCGSPCGMPVAHSRAFAAALEREQRAHCQRAVCPQYSCLPPDPNWTTLARCEAGECKSIITRAPGAPSRA